MSRCRRDGKEQDRTGAQWPRWTKKWNGSKLHILEATKGSGIVWDEAQFLDYIKDPKAKIPGTIMVFVGIKNEEDAKNLWAYLKQFDAEGKKK